MFKMMTIKTIGNNIVAINVNEISSIEQHDIDVIRIIMSNGRFYDTKGTVDDALNVIGDNLE